MFWVKALWTVIGFSNSVSLCLVLENAWGQEIKRECLWNWKKHSKGWMWAFLKMEEICNNFMKIRLRKGSQVSGKKRKKLWLSVFSLLLESLWKEESVWYKWIHPFNSLFFSPSHFPTIPKCLLYIFMCIFVKYVLLLHYCCLVTKLCHDLLQGIFPTQRSNPCVHHWQVGSLPLSHQGLSQGASEKTLILWSWEWPLGTPLGVSLFGELRSRKTGDMTKKKKKN